MPAQRRIRTSRSIGLVSVLLLSTALAAPAFAQIEEVIVTAQKRTEDVQTVPIAITAFTSQDLKAHRIDRFKDLQFSTPNISYTKANFTGSDFQIRGIGVTAIGYDQESGVAINFNDVFLAAPDIADAGFYDLQRVEVLRGPQSTLYGRGATGGVVSVVGAKPDLDSFGTDLEATYGNYDYTEVKGMVNVPIVTDQLGLRIAGDWIHHSGFTTNLFDHSHPDNRSQYSVRGTLRWQPTDKTTVDVTAAFSNENDHKMRSQKQACHTDPSGILGCLPDSSPVSGLVNTNATLATIASSVQGMQSTLGAGLSGIYGYPAGYIMAGNLGLVDLTVPPTLPAGVVNPAGIRQVFTSFDPTYKSQDNFMSLEWNQSWTSWLDSTFVGGYDRETVMSQESYNNIPGTIVDPTRLAVAEATFNFITSTLPTGGPAYAANYAQFFSTPGKIPLSGTTQFGTLGGNYTFTNEMAAYDQSDGTSTQWSGELRFNTKFNGPFNAMLAGYYLNQHSGGNYFVNAPTLDYPAIVLGGIVPPMTALFKALGFIPASSPNNAAAMGACLTKGCILGPGYYRNNGDYDSLISEAIYGEVYYTAIPDTLKFTVGGRYTEDIKFQRGRIELFNAYLPIGTVDEAGGLATAVSQQQVNFDASQPGYNVWQLNKVTFRKWTGRFVADWTPKLDFTDATLVYASYARGYKAGGFNPGIEPGLGVPASYGPEQIDAFELGTKNTILGGTVQANGDVWYYDYKGLQVSKIENNTSVNENIDASLYGVEGEFIWAPDDHWQFSLNYANTHTSIGNSSSIDPRNPTNGNPNALLIKDATISGTVGENCVLYYNGAAPGSLPSGFFPGVGGVGALASVGIPYSAYGSCSGPAPAGFSWSDPANSKNVAGGVPVSLKGNWLQNTPENTLSFGVQYTQPLMDDYHLVARMDYYWQSMMYGRIFNTAADKIPSWDVMNLQLTLNSPDDMWYVQGFIKNVMDNNNMTGMYLTSPTSGLYTNEFYGDPRTYGITLGIHM
ncbi:MAG: TonB-dependent receptor [Alphaproteobacteria bacterium]|nr:TonB-dependent receptor [Alphaproteobacteria bacterium]MDE2072556.1 TonB-dependent receptor [Alphaproteobacteria bacterium]